MPSLAGIVPPVAIRRCVPGVAVTTPKLQVSATFAGFTIDTCAGRLSVMAAAVSGTSELLKNEMRKRLTSPGSRVAGVNCLFTVTVASAAGAASSAAAPSSAATAARPPRRAQRALNDCTRARSAHARSSYVAKVTTGHPSGYDRQRPSDLRMCNRPAAIAPRSPPAAALREQCVAERQRKTREASRKCNVPLGCNKYAY